jgi:hypothetical protein
MVRVAFYYPQRRFFLPLGPMPVPFQHARYHVKPRCMLAFLDIYIMLFWLDSQGLHRPAPTCAFPFLVPK